MCAGAGIPMTWTLPFPDSDILKQQEARDERQNDAAAGATEVMRIMFFAEFFHGGQTPAAWLWRIQNSVAHVSFMPESVRRLQSLHNRSRTEMARPEQRAARLGVPGGIECLHSDDDDCAPGNDLTERGQWAVGIGIEDRKYIGAGSNYAVVAPDGMMFIFDPDPVVGAGPFSSSFDR